MDDTLLKPRRWFRFSLRTMFVLVTVLCVIGFQSLTIFRLRKQVEALRTENSHIRAKSRQERAEHRARVLELQSTNPQSARNDHP